MVDKKFALIALLTLLFASVSASAAGANSVPESVSKGHSEPPAPGTYNQAVQVFAQVVPAWEQVNSNGFGDIQTDEVSALEVFNGYLYAGTSNPISGARIFRSQDGSTWNPVTAPGFGNPHDTIPPAILDLMVFKSYLYASTGRGNASQIWRSLNGVTWAPMNQTGFSNPDNVDLTSLAEFGGKIYAGVTNQVGGAQIWSSLSGNNNTWTQVGPTVAGTIPATITDFAIFDFDNGLYAAVEFESNLPAQIWRSYGGAWEIIVNDGFGDANTLSTGGMAGFGGYLYVGAGSTADGAQLWRTNDGATWEQAITPGFSDPNNQKVEAVFVFQNQLYVSVRNAVTGIEIWRSTDGTLWEQANTDGFGDSNNIGTNWSNASADFMNQLYLGTSNVVDGGELWRMLRPPTYTLRRKSQPKYDGWVLESGETTGAGGTMNNLGTVLLLGDNAQDKQYRAVLSFGTAAIPDNAVITKVLLKVKKAGVTGTNPMKTHSDLAVDIRKGKFYTLPNLQINDFQAKASMYGVGKFSRKPFSGWYRSILISAAFPYINVKGRTQLRLGFLLDDNDDNNADIIKLFSGNDLLANRPQLIIQYYVP